MKVHINVIKGKRVGYKIRWTEDGKPKEAFRKEYKDATALQASVRERLIGDSKEEYRKTHLSDSQLKDAEPALLKLNGRLSLRESPRLALYSVDLRPAKLVRSIELSGENQGQVCDLSAYEWSRNAPVLTAFYQRNL